MQSASKGLQIQKQLSGIFFIQFSFIRVQLLLCEGKIASNEMQSALQPYDCKRQLFFSTIFSLYLCLGQQSKGFEIVFALLKKALTERFIYQSFSIFSKYKGDWFADCRRQLSVTLAPLGKILPSIHNAGQIAGK